MEHNRVANDRFVYLNGSFMPEKDAKLSVFDRATLFADAVYEVCCFIDGKFLDFDAHMERLKNSLQALNITFSVNTQTLYILHRELILKNHLETGIVYLQISRGVSERDFHYNNHVTPSFFMFTQPVSKQEIETIRTYKMISMPEGRWAKRGIKTTQLLYSSLAKTKAHESGVNDVVYVEDGFITEATSANFHIIDQDGTLITRQLDGSLLPGITRARLLQIARDNHIRVEERCFSLQDAFDASEVFLSSASAFVRPVIEIDGKIIGSGQIGPLSKQLFALYQKAVPRS